MAYAFNDDKTKAEIITRTKTLNVSGNNGVGRVSFIPSDFGLNDFTNCIVLECTQKIANQSFTSLGGGFPNSGSTGATLVYPYYEKTDNNITVGVWNTGAQTSTRTITAKLTIMKLN